MRMMTSVAIGVLLAAAAIAGCSRSESQDGKAAEPVEVSNVAAPPEETAHGAGAGVAAEALRRASDTNKHVFVLFSSAEDEPTRVAREALDRAVRSMGRSAEWVAVDIMSGSEAAIVDKYGLRSSPMPVVLAFAPNGAVTGGFRSADISEEKLKSAIASRGMQECLKALQERKIVFICSQGTKTQSNREALQGVNEFKADARYAAHTVVVKVDPADAAEKSFLTLLKMDPNARDAATALLVPPNTVLGVMNGATSKASLLRLVASASSGCGSKGCSPSGCGPVKK